MDDSTDYSDESPVTLARTHERFSEWLSDWDPFFNRSRWWPKCRLCGSYHCETNFMGPFLK